MPFQVIHPVRPGERLAPRSLGCSGKSEKAYQKNGIDK